MNEHWKERPEAGSSLAIRITIWIALKLGRRALAVVLYPTALYFLCVRGSERRASRAFLERVTGHRATLLQVFGHFLTFARVTADRIFFLAGRTDQIPIEVFGFDIVERHVQAGHPCIMLGSHVGSLEAMRQASLRHPGITVRLVLDRKSNRKLVERLEALDPGFAASLIDADQSPASLGLAISDALKRGDSIGFLCDRYRPEDRTTTCEFLGSPAKFPVGPFIIASIFRAPVVSSFGIYVNGRYEVHCEELFASFRLSRQDRDEALQQAVARYAERLEHYVRRAPNNWFNFYDFWQTG
jgi:predicted LPLAT superfamily acyltransferase